MIDNPEQVERLIARLTAALPLLEGAYLKMSFMELILSMADLSDGCGDAANRGAKSRQEGSQGSLGEVFCPDSLPSPNTPRTSISDVPHHRAPVFFLHFTGTV
jgi:hypothetical protein